MTKGVNFFLKKESAVVKHSQIGIFFFFALGISYSVYSAITSRLLLGPAWLSYLSHKTASVTPEFIDLSPSIEKIYNPPTSLMPYIGWGAYADIYKVLNTRIQIGGGVIRKGRVEISDSFKRAAGIFEKGRTEGSSSINLLIVDGNLGLFLQSNRIALAANPLLGYAYNKQHLTENIFLTDERDVRSIKTHWKGPYIGLELQWPCSDTILLTWWYKFVMGHVTSCQRLSLSPDLAAIAPATRFSYKTSMFGNLWGAELFFNCSCWQLGCNFSYINYQNHKPTSISLPANPIARRARLESVFWQQIIVGIFAEYIF